MLFTSVYYILFLTIIVIAFYFLPARFRWLWLLIASSGYYLSFLPIFILLIVAIILMNYFLTRWMVKTGGSHADKIFVFILGMNILLLAFFKYYNNIFPNSEIYIRGLAFFNSDHEQTKLIIPLGFSYVIFTVLSYLIELKRGNISVESHLGFFSLYILLFPKIAQGPIERPQHLIPQLKKEYPVNFEDISEGMKQILWGLFKKIVVADRVALYVNTIYNNNEQHNGTSLLLATVLFSFQIYADFSGYTDIALGSARVFGLKLTNNFRRPYFASSIKDFWDRWHISFSSWLRDYIFFPLSYFLTHNLQRRTFLLVSIDRWIYFLTIMITFVVCGVWHGVGLTFLVWGGFFGIFLSFSNLTKNLNKNLRKKLGISRVSLIYRIYRVFITFLLITFTWIFFRSDSLSMAGQIINKIFTNIGVPYLDLINLGYSLIGVTILLLKDFFDEYYPNRLFLFNNKCLAIRYASYLIVLFMIIICGVFEGNNFIYFQF